MEERMDTNILLESGTNELEILEFIVGGNYYGINVAKIREILTYTALTPIPNAHPNVEGAFSTRGETISVVNLAKCLGIDMSTEEEKDRYPDTGEVWWQRHLKHLKKQVTLTVQ